MKTKNKVLMPVIAITILIATVIVMININQFSRYLDTSMDETINTALDGSLGLIDEMKPATAVASLYISENTDVVQAIEDEDYSDLLTQLKRLLVMTGGTICTVTNASGIVIARTHMPELTGDSLADKASIKSALSGQALTYVEEGTAVRLAVATSNPIYNEQGTIIGVVIAGDRLDSNMFVDLVQKIYKCEASIVIRNERIATTVLDSDGVRIIGSHIADDIAEQAALKKNTYIDSWFVNGHKSYMGTEHILDINGDIVGFLLLGFYDTEAASTIVSFILTIVLSATVLLAVFFVSITLIANSIVTSVNNLVHVANELIPEKLRIAPKRNESEIKHLTYVFERMVETTRTRMVEDDRQLLRMSSLIGDSPQYIAYITFDGQFAYFNDVILEISGYSREELDSKGIFILYSDETNKYIREKILPEIYNYGKIDFEIPLIRKDKKVRIMAFTGFRFDDGQNVLCGTIASDITEKKKLAEALEQTRESAEEARKIAEKANQAKSQFLANMSHEIRTPMNTVISMTELLMDETLTARQATYLSDIKSASTNLLGIINDILDFSKIESGVFEITPVHFDFSVFLENINTIFKFATQDKNLKFLFRISDNLPKYLYGDDIRIRQVITNILSNAIKFTREGSVSFVVWADKQKIYFDIADTGIGIKQENLGEVFLAFKQLDANANRYITGSGLGLSISKELIELMGGSITVESQYGVGSIFHIMLPRIEGSADKVLNLTETNKVVFSASDVLVLVVDDYEPNLKIVRSLLNLANINCDTVKDGETAISMIAQNKYDLVFMDQMMPSMDGIETTKRIRAMGYNQSKLPIIALTANAVKGTKEMLLKSGMDDYLSKPINRKLFVDMLIKWLPPQKVFFLDGKVAPEVNEILDSEIKKLYTITALDVKAGLELLGGAQEIYIDTLRGLCKKIPENIKNMNSFLKNGNIEKFSIAIHSIKSALSTTAAHELAKLAAEMEHHSRNSDIVFCIEKFPEFSKKLLSLHEQLCPILRRSTDLQETLEPEMAVQKLISCLEKFDDITALDILGSLQDSVGNESELIGVLKRQIELFEYDAAKKTADKLLKNLHDRK